MRDVERDKARGLNIRVLLESCGGYLSVKPTSVIFLAVEIGALSISSIQIKQSVGLP